MTYVQETAQGARRTVPETAMNVESRNGSKDSSGAASG